METRDYVLARIKGFSLGVLLMLCWLFFATVYSAFRYSPGRVRYDYEYEAGLVIEDTLEGESLPSEVRVKAELYDIRVVEAYSRLKKIDDKDSLVEDARRAAQAVQDICIELNMENCL